MRQAFLITSLYLLLTACGQGGVQNAIDDGPSAQAGGENSLTNRGPIHSQGGWRDTVTILVESDAPDIIVEATQAAIDSWNEAAGAGLMSYEGRVDATEQSTLYSTLEDTDTVIYYDEDWAIHTGKSAGVLGTTIWENEANDDNYIARGDIILNAESFLYQDATTEALDEGRVYDIVDAESVLLHEMGHLLGLDHVTSADDAYSVMHAKTSVGLNIYSRLPSDGDAERIRSIYGN